MIEIGLEKDLYLARYAELARKNGRRNPEWLRAIRKAAAARFEALGFPTTRDEEWRFTSVAPIARTAFVPADPPAVRIDPERLAALTWPDAGAIRLVLVNGFFSPELSSVGAPGVPAPEAPGAPTLGSPAPGAPPRPSTSPETPGAPPRSPASPAAPAGSLPPGVVAGGLAAALEVMPDEVQAHLARHARYETQPFTALNTALMEDGVFLGVPDGVTVEAPVHIISLSLPDGRPTVAHPRVLIVAGRSSRLAVVESYAGEAGRVFTNAVTEIVAGPGAVVDHYRLQREDREAYHVAALEIHAAADAVVSSHSISLGGALVRNEVNAVLNGEGAECTLNGLYIATGEQHVDNHTGIDHARPRGTSHELYKGVLNDRARAVFNGRIRVRPDAQQTDSKQTNKNLLLSDEALVNTNPQLEIYADDVKCTHGATVGQLEETSLFYLRSRGIPEPEARQILTRAFAGDIVGRIRISGLREGLETLMAGMFDHAAGRGGSS